MADRTVDRRAVLVGGAALLGGAAAGAALATAVQAEPVASEALHGSEQLPFRGAHQAGVETPQQAHGWFVALDLREGVARDGLVQLLRLWTDDAERLVTGHGGRADLERELAASPARLTVTVGAGASLFVKLRLEDRRPPSLHPLPAFRIDRLDPRWSEGDLLLQVAADDVMTVSHAVRVLTRAARPFAELRWVQRGFVRARGTEPTGVTPRNSLGQVDGTVNPAPGTDDFARVVWAQDGPAWWHGGTMLVLRRTRLEVDAWEQLGRSDRELVVGRRLADGSPLTGGLERDPVDLTVEDANGLLVVPETAHVRLARAQGPGERMLRRGWSYDETGTGADLGLLFCAYVADVDRQFVPVQRRLEDDLLARWATPVGSAVYAILPGLGPEDRFLGQALLA